MTELNSPIDQFTQRAEIYGANLDRWPAQYANEARSLLETHPELRERLDAESKLDELLDQYATPYDSAGPSSLAGLEASILQKTFVQPPLLEALVNQLLTWLTPEVSVWRPALAACLPVLVGLSIGSNIGENEQYVLVDEIELISIDNSSTANLIELTPQPTSKSGGEQFNEI